MVLVTGKSRQKSLVPVLPKNAYHYKRYLYQNNTETPVASIPGLPRFFFLRFAFSIIHGSGKV